VPAPWSDEGKATIKCYGLDVPPRSFYQKNFTKSLVLRDLQEVAETLPGFDTSVARTKDELFKALSDAGAPPIVFLDKDKAVRERFQGPLLIDTDHPDFIEWRNLWRQDLPERQPFWNDVEARFASGEFSVRHHTFFAFARFLEEQFQCCICMSLPPEKFHLSHCGKTICDACYNQLPKKSVCPFCNMDGQSFSLGWTQVVSDILAQVLPGKVASRTKQKTASSGSRRGRAKSSAAAGEDADGAEEGSSTKKTSSRAKKAAAPKKRKDEDADDDEGKKEKLQDESATKKKRGKKSAANLDEQQVLDGASNKLASPLAQRANRAKSTKQIEDSPDFRPVRKERRMRPQESVKALEFEGGKHDADFDLVVEIPVEK
jgi:hypothetical protein